jgi:hypothetical protein
MANDAELVPELSAWNDGRGISLADWVCIEGRSDHALGYCAMVWPDLVEFEGYVLRSPINIARLRAWEAAGHARSQIETVMNAYLFDSIFPSEVAESALKDARQERLAAIMADMLAAKLARSFPDRRFSVFVLDEGGDFGVSFHQV